MIVPRPAKSSGTLGGGINASFLFSRFYSRITKCYKILISERVVQVAYRGRHTHWQTEHGGSSARNVQLKNKPESK
jgi:hypothetical protein